MKKILSCMTAAALTVSMFAGCGKKDSVVYLEPMMGLSWFDGYDSVKTELDEYTLIRERETQDDVSQRMLDYSGVDLFDISCDLTLCFTDSGLVGFNYHDTGRNQSYRTWLRAVEDHYGSPTESGTGMASWYDDPLGKNTAVYLFNLQEGVQVSFYATADSPDKSYEKQRQAKIPTPEIRTPVVPIPEEYEDVQPDTDAEAVTTAPVVTDGPSLPIVSTAMIRMPDEYPEITDENIEVPEDSPLPEMPEEQSSQTTQPGQTVTDVHTTATSVGTGRTTSRSGTGAVTTTAVTTVKPATTTAPVTTVNREKDFLLNGLQFYGSADSERKKMSAYTQLYEYKTEEPGQPWELIMEYERVTYLGRKCDAVLCFTSLGLVGINYFDSKVNSYSFWNSQLTRIYGTADSVEPDYSVWSSDPVGKGTMIYLFALDDGVQISFFTDDTGSEMS